MNRLTIERIIVTPDGTNNWCEYKVNNKLGYEPLGELALDITTTSNKELVEHLKDSILDVYLYDEVTNERLTNKPNIKSVSYLLDHIVRNCIYKETTIENTTVFNPQDTIEYMISATEYQLVDNSIIEHLEDEVVGLSLDGYFLFDKDTCNVTVNPFVISQFLF